MLLSSPPILGLHQVESGIAERLGYFKLEAIDHLQNCICNPICKLDRDGHAFFAGRQKFCHEGRMMNSKLWFATLIIASSAFAAPALADGLFAAISFSPSTGENGSAWNYESAALAETEAMGQCGFADCYTAVSFDKCGAIAVGDGFGMGFAADQTKQQAEEAALASCNSYTTTCKVTASLCNDGF